MLYPKKVQEHIKLAMDGKITYKELWERLDKMEPYAYNKTTDQNSTSIEMHSVDSMFRLIEMLMTNKR